MLAIVTMILVSCGGERGNGINLADPAFTYFHPIPNNPVWVDITNCLLVKNFDVKNENNEIVVSVKVEMVKEPEVPITCVSYHIFLLDEEEHVIAIGESGYIYLVKEGEIVSDKTTLKIVNDMSIDDAIKKAKFVKFDDVTGYKI